MVALVYQIDKVSIKLLDYGILGVMVISLGFILYKMWEKINKDQAMWRTEAIESRKAFITLSQNQNSTNQKLIEIRERDVDEQKNHHIQIEGKINSLPYEIRQELRNELNERENKTSAG